MAWGIVSGMKEHGANLMTDELKPCPKCGHTPRVWYFENEKYWSVRCIGSERQTGYIDHSFETTGETEEDAITAWNARAEPDEIPMWAIKEIQRIRNFVAGSRFGDWKCDLCYDSECFQAVKAGIDRYLTLILSLKKGEE